MRSETPAPVRAKQTALSLDTEDKALLARLHKSTGVKQVTDLVRLALRALAKKEFGPDWETDTTHQRALTGTEG